MRVALPCLLLLAACARFPVLDARITAADLSAPIPALQPLAPILAGAEARGAGPPVDISARIAALLARAAALRGSVIDPATAARIAAAVR